MAGMEEHKGEFLSDARDHLDSLNADLLALEKSGADPETINRLFRAFHTLKGNAAMMGYTRYSELAHALEDLLGKLRDRQLDVTRSIIDLLFEGVDHLEEGLTAISNDVPDNVNAQGIVNEVAHLLLVKEQTAQKEDAFVLTPDDLAAARASEGSGEHAFRVAVIFDPTNPLRFAKALIVVRELEKSGTVLKMRPSREQLAKGSIGSDAEFLYTTRSPVDALKTLIAAVVGVREVRFLGIEQQYERSPEILHEEKEHAKEQLTRMHVNEAMREIRSVKVDMVRLDKLMNLVGELLISNIRLQEVFSQRDEKGLRQVSEGIDRLILDLQDQVMTIRMVPIETICRRFPRMVRDLAEKEQKSIDLVMSGQETEFDRTVLDQIGDPLVHLLRNSVDHGIEMPDERRRQGKPEQGVIRIAVARERSHAVIQLSDDGKGIDPEAVKRSCLRKGTLSEADAVRMTPQELQMLIFRPGVSTAEKVTEVSGRGVGMDVVLSKVRELGGTVGLDSQPGHGTTVTIRLPLSIAILPALLVTAGNDTFAIPLSSVEQIVDVAPSSVKTIQGHEVFLLRGRNIPLFSLRSLTGSPSAGNSHRTTIIVNQGGLVAGIVVDAILAQQQVLIKGLHEIVKGAKGSSGATILADGRVVLILDLDTLFL